jgi:hypothetical protein
MPRTECVCGSGLGPWLEYDARGISVGYVCQVCVDDKLAKYRPECFNDPDYIVDEQIEPEE